MTNDNKPIDYEKKGGYNPPPSNGVRPKKPTPSPPPKK
jgi:hypothetical protein